MLYPLWTAKGGAGCTTIAAVLATLLVDRARDVLLVDLGGDLPAALGVPEPPNGLTDWLAAPQAGDGALRRLEVPIADGLGLLPRGTADRWQPDRAAVFARLLREDDRPIVVDVAVADHPGASAMSHLRGLFAADAQSVLVTQPCYLAIRRAMALPYRPAAVALFREQRGFRRSFNRFDVADLVGAPVRAQVDRDPAVARSVDCGQLVSRPPRPLSRQVQGLLR